MTGGIRIGLKDFDPGRKHAIRIGGRFVISDLRSCAVSKDPFVDERKMADVQEVLDDARSARLHPIWSSPQHLVGPIIEELEAGHVAGRLPRLTQITPCATAVR